MFTNLDEIVGSVAILTSMFNYISYMYLYFRVTLFNFFRSISYFSLDIITF